MAHRMTALLAELGPGFSFVGHQVPLQVGETTFYLDLLFFHLELRRFVVVELKTGAATGPMAAVTYQALPDALRTQLPSPKP